MYFPRRLPLVAIAIATLATYGCAPQEDADDESGRPAELADCKPADLQTLAKGKLTVATDTPAFEPWFSDDDPTNGEGYESAVAYAIAEKLGYEESEVEWVEAGFNQAIQPGKKSFDFDINQFSITEKRRKAVDLSVPYYQAAQAIVVLESSPSAKVTTLTDLGKSKVGAQIGTTSLSAIEEQILLSGRRAFVYEDTTKAAQALQNRQVDAIVADLPTAFYLVSAELEGAKIIGQFQPETGESEQFGVLLTKGSAVTNCINSAISALDEDGTLASLERKWLSQSADVPAIKP